MTPQPGKIAHYQITSKLGEGGMGAVYRATDTKLNRDVAIKVLPDALAADPDRLARFLREAQVLASLNHPNIASIYGVEDQALVMELVEGPELAGPLSEAEALPIIHQLIDALDYAHDKGIVHRDLKPANLKLTPDGRLKVLDFGLAKALAAEAPPAGNTLNSPTLTMRATMAGVIMGTAGYMSPEQARGQSVDRRADIWAFGVVVYELLTGLRLFDGPTVTDILAAVVRQDLELDAVPPRFRKLLRLCLERDPRRRLRDIGDARILLDEPETLAGAPASPRRALPWTLAAISVLAAAALAVVHFRETPPQAPVIRTSILPPEHSTFAFSRQFGSVPAISPDGSMIAFTAFREQGAGSGALWVRPLNSQIARELPGTRAGALPSWSPDGKSIVFSADTKLKRVDIAGGLPVTLADLGTTLGGAAASSWGPNDTILFSKANGGIQRVSAAGGPATAVTILPPNSTVRHNRPSFLPDGKHFLYQVSMDRFQESAIYLGSIDHPSEPGKPVADPAAGYRYDRGYLLLLRTGNLFAQAFDPDAGRITGPPQLIVEQIATDAGASGIFATSASGLLVYQGGVGIGLRQLAWLDRLGKLIENVGEPAAFGPFALSPDGKSVAAAIVDAQAGARDIWIVELPRGVRTRLTAGGSRAVSPVWSPDSKMVLYSATRDSNPGLYRKPADSSGPEEPVLVDANPKFLSHYSHDGKWLLYYTGQSETTRTWVLPVEPGAKPRPLFEPPRAEIQATLSPDGKWVAYRSIESGRLDVYISQFPGPGGKRQVSTSAVGGVPTWSRDGHELYYISGNRDLVSVRVEAKGNDLEIGPPQRLFGPILSVGGRGYDVSADGRRFLTLLPVGGDAAEPPLTLVQNWPELLKK